MQRFRVDAERVIEWWHVRCVSGWFTHDEHRELDALALTWLEHGLNLSEAANVVLNRKVFRLAATQQRGHSIFLDRRDEKAHLFLNVLKLVATKGFLVSDVLRSHLLLVGGVVCDMAEKLEPETIDRVLAQTVHVRETDVHKLARHEA